MSVALAPSTKLVSEDKGKAMIKTQRTGKKRGIYSSDGLKRAGEGFLEQLKHELILWAE